AGNASGAVVYLAPGRPRLRRRLTGARVLHAHLQLRRLADGHGQLCPPDGEEPQPLRRAAVRANVLRPPHRPRQRRTPRHRLHRGGVRAGERDGDPDGHGANFAIISATANNGTFFAGNGLNINPFSLDTQMLWFRTHLRQLVQAAAAAASSPSPQNGTAGNLLGGALVLLGEIGGNDYNLAFSGGVPRDTVRRFVPAVVEKLAGAVEELVAMGARAFVVPGNLPFGCTPLYLRRFGGGGEQSAEYWEYDAETGCLAWFNRFAEYHNEVLTARLDRLRRRHPGVTIVYADWYGAMMSIFQDPGERGFTNALKSCCGNQTVPCGKPGCRVCDDPSTYGSWDGTHPTEAVYKVIADGVLYGPYASPVPLIDTC
ncbi:unnamed protein product, partial [Urochloa humidicola]